MDKVIVTDCHLRQSVVILRSFGKRRILAIGASDRKFAAGIYSKYTSGHLVYPSPKENPKAFVSYLLNEVKSGGYDLIIPVSDFTLLPIADNRERFLKYTRLAIPPENAIRIAFNKVETMKLARSLGVPTPRTVDLDSGDHSINYPLVIKPSMSYAWENDNIVPFPVSYANELSDAKITYEKVRTASMRCNISPPIVQEYVNGDGYGISGIYKKGAPIVLFQHKRLRMSPPTGGVSVLRESTRLHNKMCDYTLRLMEKLQWDGVSMVEFKMGESGEPVLMEINGRFWGSLPLAVNCGVDFPYLTYQLFMGEEVGAMDTKNLKTTYKVGVKGRYLMGDVLHLLSVLFVKRKSYLEYPGRLETTVNFLNFFQPNVRYDLFSIEDPMPFVIDAIDTSKNILRRVLK